METATEQQSITSIQRSIHDNPPIYQLGQEVRVDPHGDEGFKAIVIGYSFFPLSNSWEYECYWGDNDSDWFDAEDLAAIAPEPRS